ncbi:MAG: DUF2339 domain-containing protein [Acetatifactor muris]|nr:DUF2339 domain-containing protein [Acetatifactor muris]MCM1525937.1 DUF2339 domain-containing protein [Bacteroides sp.]
MYFNNLDENNRDARSRNEIGLRQLQGRIAFLIEHSEDFEFTDYLRQRQAFLAGHENQWEQLAADLDRKVVMYENRMRARRMQQQVPQPMPPMQQQASQPVPPVPQFVPQQEQPVAQPAPPVQQQTLPPVQQMSQPQPEPSAPQQAPQPIQPVQKEQNMEFAVGAAVLSIVGAAFVLTAMVLYGIYFMEGLTKGLLFYVVSLAVMLLSEIFLYRRWQRLGMTFSAIGMGGLYISTLVNYLVLHNFNQWAAMALTLLITLAVILLSRKRDAAAYRILGMVAMYVCILIVPYSEISGEGLPFAEFVTASVMALIVNVMCIVVPVRKSHTNIQIIHMILNTAFMLITIMGWSLNDVFQQTPPLSMEDGLWQLQIWQRPVVLAVSFLVMQLIFVTQLLWNERQTQGETGEDNVGICVTYGVSALLFFQMAYLTADFSDMQPVMRLFGEEHLFERLICTMSAVAPGMVFFLIIRKKQEKWLIWYLMNLWVLAVHCGHGGAWERSISLLALLLVAKICSFTKEKPAMCSDILLTTFVCVTVVSQRGSLSVIPLVIGLLLSVLCLNYLHTYFETILTFALAIYIASHMLPALKLPVFVGILFVGMLVFNNVKRWQGRKIIVFNILALCGQVAPYLLLINPVYRNSYLTYLCMAVFGTAVIVVCLSRQYHLEFEGKSLVLAIFLTYMGLIVRTDYPIVNSILLMTIALSCVGYGFIIRKKPVRVYGLVLSLAVCAKLVLYDFMGVNILQKTIVFFAVGMLALAISAIYMILERGNEKRNAIKQNEM